MKQINIAGAGLVGSLLAILLKKRGYDVTVYEKRPDIRKANNEKHRSINLVITSRGIHGLKQAGLLSQAMELSTQIFGRMIHSKTGELAYQPYGQNNECNLSISRAELNKFLITSAEAEGVKINFQHEVKDITTQPNQILFGTDGAGSLVRKSMNVPESTEWLEANYIELHIPPNNNLQKNALHIWPRGSHMMMALANLDGSFTVTLYMPKEMFKTIEDETDVEKLFKSEFPDAIALMPNYIDDFLDNPQGHLGTVRCNQWVKDSVVLMGDAAHAIVPFFGQGMNCGLEDCTTLMSILDKTNDWSQVLKQYEQIQKPNANAIADMALENWVEMKEKVGDKQFLFRKKIESLLEQNFPTMYKSRYGMITYTLIPYALAQHAGRLQDKILTQLCANIETPEQLDLTKAKSLLEADFAPFLKHNNIDLTKVI